MGHSLQVTKVIVDIAKSRVFRDLRLFFQTGWVRSISPCSSSLPISVTINSGNNIRDQQRRTLKGSKKKIMKDKGKEKNLKNNQRETIYYLQGSTDLNDSAFFHLNPWRAERSSTFFHTNSNKRGGS